MVRGTADSRPGLRAYLTALRPGETLAVWRLSVLALTLPAIAAVVAAVDARGGCLRVIEGPGAGPAWPAFVPWLRVFAACGDELPVLVTTGKARACSPLRGLGFAPVKFP